MVLKYRWVGCFIFVIALSILVDLESLNLIWSCLKQGPWRYVLEEISP